MTEILIRDVDIRLIVHRREQVVQPAHHNVELCQHLRAGEGHVLRSGAEGAEAVLSLFEER